MSFWAYLLHCRGGAFYAGHTDDLNRRIAEHQSGLIPGFTADRLPVELVWSQDFATRDEAKAAEARVNGWSRAKKLALIRGDWGRISDLAKKKSGVGRSYGSEVGAQGQKKYGPSTSSGWAGFGVNSSSSSSSSVYPELVEGSSFALQAHPAHPSLDVTAVAARILRLDANWLTLRWKVTGTRRLILPPFAGKGRADGLWQTTCFELFVQREGEAGYAEFNLSPSERWAAYDFSGYRDGMTERPMARDPVCTPRRGGDVMIFDAAISAGALPALPWRYGLTAVIEEEGGAKSFWAIAHSPEKPDFHHPACFAGRLAAPEAT